jgi:hypothetical protein
VTKIVCKWKKADLTAQPVAGKVTEPPNDFFTEMRTLTEIIELFFDDKINEPLSHTPTYTLQVRV